VCQRQPDQHVPAKQPDQHVPATAKASAAAHCQACCLHVHTAKRVVCAHCQAASLQQLHPLLLLTHTHTSDHWACYSLDTIWAQKAQHLHRTHQELQLPVLDRRTRHARPWAAKQHAPRKLSTQPNAHALQASTTRTAPVRPAGPGSASVQPPAAAMRWPLLRQHTSSNSSKA